MITGEILTQRLGKYLTEEIKVTEEDDLEVKRESLAILASLGSTEEFLGKAMSLGDIKRLSPKGVEK